MGEGSGLGSHWARHGLLYRKQQCLGMTREPGPGEELGARQQAGGVTSAYTKATGVQGAASGIRSPSGHRPKLGSARPRPLKQLCLNRTSAHRERCDVPEHRAECGFEGTGMPLDLGKDRSSLDGGIQGRGQSIAATGRRRKPRWCVALGRQRIVPSHRWRVWARSVRQSG